MLSEQMLAKVMHIDEELADLKKMIALQDVHKKYPKEYQVFRRLKNRATNPNNPKYDKGYGERGICEEWLSPYGFLDFLADVGPMPSYEKNGKVSKWSIDRVDNTLGYFKGNCRWATALEQIHNRSNTRYVNIDGERLLLREALIKYNIKEDVYTARLRYGWSQEKALKTPPAHRKRKHDKMEQKPTDPTTQKPYEFGVRKYAVKGDRLEPQGELQWS